MRPDRDDSSSIRDGLAPTRASLLARLKNLEDDQSWKEFFDTYHRLIYATVIRRGLPAQDAEDVVAEIVEGVARRMPDFVYDPKRCSFKTWLFRIVEYRVASHFRRRGRIAARMEAEAGESLDEIPDPATLEPDKRWEEAWQENLIQTALDRVRRRANARYVQIYLYSEVEGHGVEETAQHLRTTVNDVSVARHRVTKMLREEMQRLMKEEERREHAV